MKLDEAIKVIDLETSCDSHKSYEAYETFFKCFNVNLRTDNGEYKNIYDIFKEANRNFNRR